VERARGLDERRARKLQTQFRSRRASSRRRRTSSGRLLINDWKKSADFDLGANDSTLGRSSTLWLNNSDSSPEPLKAAGVHLGNFVRTLTPNENTESVAIALSGYGMQQDIERSRAAGFQVNLIKPVSPQQLQMTIDQLIKLHYSDCLKD
jgi:CheY-like chemotaxis protein